MWQMLGSVVDAFHALLMAAWVLGLPLLFWPRWPRLTRAYGIYAIGFILGSQASHLLLGECVFTRLARFFWELPGPGDPRASSREWFTVRLAEAVFHLTPSHRSIVLVSEGFILATAVGVLVSLRVSSPSREDRFT
jgi:hypothetical protein